MSRINGSVSPYFYDWFSRPLPVLVVRSKSCCPASDCVPLTGYCPEIDDDLETDAVSVCISIPH